VVTTRGDDPGEVEPCSETLGEPVEENFWNNSSAVG
jgi:hypothetical protein